MDWSNVTAEELVDALKEVQSIYPSRQDPKHPLMAAAAPARLTGRHLGR
jgi:hypothetical protein